MRLLYPTTEAEMVALFLKAEIASERFGQQIVDLLARSGQSRALIERPDLANAGENLERRQILCGYRAYLSEELPTQVNWYRARLSREEVAQVRYIDDSYWNALSRNTRLPKVAVETIRQGQEIFGQSNQRFLDAEAAYRKGVHFPLLIVTGATPESVLTLIEGHLRLTAYLLAYECLPDELEVLAGFAPEFAEI